MILLMEFILKIPGMLLESCIIVLMFRVLCSKNIALFDEFGYLRFVILGIFGSAGISPEYTLSVGQDAAHRLI